MARFNAVANYLRLSGYRKLPGQRRYIAPTGEIVSRRQAEQQSGALEALYGESTREAVARHARPSGRVTKERAAEAYKRWHDDPRSVRQIMKDPHFRFAWNDWYMGGKFRNLTSEERRRKLKAGEQFGWFRYDSRQRRWIHLEGNSP